MDISLFPFLSSNSNEILKMENDNELCEWAGNSIIICKKDVLYIRFLVDTTGR